MKHFLLFLIFVATAAFAQEFTGTFRDDEGDLHTFELLADGTLLGRLVIDDAVFDVPFEVENNQAFGVLELDGTLVGFVMTPLSATQLEVQVVPFDANAQPLVEQSIHYTFTRETATAQNPLSAKPGTTQQLSVGLSLGGLELHFDGGSSESNSNADAHLSSLREESYIFCSDGSYAYSTNDTTMFSTGGLGDFGDFSSESSDAHEGWYEVVADTSGGLVLVLQASDGRSFNYPLEQSASSITIEGAEFSVTQSSQCQ